MERQRFNFMGRNVDRIHPVEGKLDENGLQVWGGLVVYERDHGQLDWQDMETGVADGTPLEKIAEILIAKSKGLIKIEECSEMQCFNPDGEEFKLTIKPSGNGWHIVIREWQNGNAENEYIKEYMPETWAYGA